MAIIRRNYNSLNLILAIVVSQLSFFACSPTGKIRAKPAANTVNEITAPAPPVPPVTPTKIDNEAPYAGSIAIEISPEEALAPFFINLLDQPKVFDPDGARSDLRISSIFNSTGGNVLQVFDNGIMFEIIPGSQQAFFQYEIMDIYESRSTGFFTIRVNNGSEINIDPVDDRFAFAEGTQFQIEVASLLANDYGSGISVNSISNPINGSAELINAGTEVLVSVASEFQGTVQFQYDIISATGEMSVKKANVFVQVSTPIERSCSGSIILNFRAPPNLTTGSLSICSGNNVVSGAVTINIDATNPLPHGTYKEFYINGKIGRRQLIGGSYQYTDYCGNRTLECSFALTCSEDTLLVSPDLETCEATATRTDGTINQFLPDITQTGTSKLWYDVKLFRVD